MRQSHVCNGFTGLLMCLLWSGFACSQSGFVYKAPLDTIRQSGFYNISLSPRIVAGSKTELEDIRILDNAGREAPYILYTEAARPNEESFTEFPVANMDDGTGIVITNILPNNIGQLFLLIKNSAAQRLATLSGSDDGQQWFVIKENILLQNEYAADSDAFVQSVSFPPTNYRYFRITMPGKNMLPLNIVKAGVYRPNFSGSSYDTLPAPRIVQTDSSDKRSYVYLLFNDNYLVDKLVITFSGVKFYKRAIAVFDKNAMGSPLAEDTVLPSSRAGMELHVKSNRLLLVINNRDNAPLRVDNVGALQLHTSVTAYLDAGKEYALYFGDSLAVMPSYDLGYFNDSIGSNIFPLAVGDIEQIRDGENPAQKAGTAGKWLLWGAITAVLLLLILFSARMMKELDTKNKQDVHL